MRALVAGLCMALLLSGAAWAAAPPDTLKLPLLAAPPGNAAPAAPPRSADADAATYVRCMAHARDNPGAGRKTAENWLAHGGEHPAEHCLAVALIGLKQYKEAAGRLEKLAAAMIRAPAPLRAEVLGQAAQAWLLAGDAGRAYAADGAALLLAPDDADLLVDRAEAAGSAGWFDKAIGDLDQVLKSSPSRLDALIYRASAYRAQGRLDPALSDIEKAVQLSPDSPQALLERGNIRRLRGDDDGARQDWQRAAALAAGSPAAKAANENIARLHTAGGPAPGTTPAGSSGR